MWEQDTTELEFWLTIALAGMGIAAVINSTFVANTASVPREDMATAVGGARSLSSYPAFTEPS